MEKATQFLHKKLTETTNAIGEGLSTWQNQNRFSRLIDEKYGSLAGLEKSVENLEEKIKEAQNRFNKLEKDKNEWIDFDDSIPFWRKILSFLPFVKREISFRQRAFFSKQNLPIEAELSNAEILNWFENSLKKMADEKKHFLREINEARKLKEDSESANQKWKTWKVTFEINAEPPQLLEKLDETLRFRAFQIATHYWEGCWLREILTEISQEYKETKSVEKQQKRWRRYAKITPCFVATFHSVPNFLRLGKAKKNLCWSLLIC
ncbi:MAG: hypothetical protein HC846_13105 [Blastocatellia bacterium]|nr:hypothetical protein [Blastocatellia bacterium]